MITINRKEPWILFLGDIVLFVLALWLSLGLRSGQLPDLITFTNHLIPFSILFTTWFIVFFISGLYEKHTSIFKSRLPILLINTHVFNSFLAVVFFYFIPYFGITPKITLFIYLIVSFVLIFIWRTFGQNFLNLGSKELALMLGRGADTNLLVQEINNNPRYGLHFVSVIDLDNISNVDFGRDIMTKIEEQNISVIVIDNQNENIEKNLPNFYNLLFSRVRFVDLNRLYEDTFDRIPLSLIGYNWFLENVSLSASISYDVLKRATDMIFSALIGIVSLILYPFIYLAIKFDDHGPIFIKQNRLGQNGKPIEIIKFRTMSFNDDERAEIRKDNKVTRIGKWLRISRLDELPQMWNVFKGDLSLIGPRPELPALALVYQKEIPYYDVRHLIKPGLSGWAQLYHENHPHRGANVKETVNKLSYDLYYVKNRSLFLDLKIALKTIKTILSRTGR